MLPYIAYIVQSRNAEKNVHTIMKLHLSLPTKFLQNRCNVSEVSSNSLSNANFFFAFIFKSHMAAR
jgi:hypothetical protein